MTKRGSASRRHQLPHWASGSLAVMFALAAGATHPPSAEEAVPAALRACSTVKKNAERLACYDETIERLLSPDGDAAALRPSAEQMFGVAAARSQPAAATQPVAREELLSIAARVAALRRDSQGMAIIDLDNGQTWRQTGGAPTLLLEVGHEVTITRAALSSFRLVTPSGRTAKVKRVR